MDSTERQILSKLAFGLGSILENVVKGTGKKIYHFLNFDSQAIEEQIALKQRLAFQSQQDRK